MWGSVFDPVRFRRVNLHAPTSRVLCTSVDGPDCMLLQQQHANADYAGVSTEPFGSDGLAPAAPAAARGHGSSAMTQLLPPTDGLFTDRHGRD